MGFKFEELDKLPEIKKKRKVSLSEQILKDFIDRNVKYGSYELKNRDSARGVARRIASVIERLGLKKKVAYRGIKENKIFLERLDLEK